MGRYVIFSVVCLCCVSALAAGDNSHPQGVRFAGRGFDEQQPLQGPNWVPWFNNSNWPPKPDVYNSIGGGAREVSVKVVDCEKPSKNTDPLFALCHGVVTDNEGSAACVADPKDKGKVKGRARKVTAAPTATVPLLAVRGRLDTGTGAFVPKNELVTFACAPHFAKTDPQSLSEIPPIVGLPSDPPSDLDDSNDLGVLAKCYFWGFAQRKEGKEGDARRLNSYQACLRAARADYCGDGISQTEQGTVIQVYEPEKTKVGTPIKVTLDPPDCSSNKISDPKSDKEYTKRRPIGFQPCFEALWDHRRAVCVSHARYEEMPVQKCQTAFSKYKFTWHAGEKRVVPASPTDPVFVHCQVNDYNAAVEQARVKNRSGINTLDGGVRGCANDIPCP